MKPSKSCKRSLIQLWYVWASSAVALPQDQQHGESIVGNGDISLLPSTQVSSTQPQAPFETPPAGPSDLEEVVNPPEPLPQPVAIPAPPNIMGWFGNIGGLLGIISLVATILERIIKAIIKKVHKDKSPPSWAVTIQVGHDTTGLNGHKLQGAAGEFPQVCLWDVGGKLLGWTDQRILLQQTKLRKNKSVKLGQHGHYDHPHPEDMPFVDYGSYETVGVWPNNDKYKDSTRQAHYVTLIKRHFDAICISAVHVYWPDGDTWTFDGSWGKASNVSWYHAHVVDSHGNQRYCFWLDHAGNLDSTQDKEDEYLAGPKGPGRIGNALPKMAKPHNWPKWLWASDVLDEEGIPTGDELTEGMKKNGVDKGKTPLGVKFMAHAFQPEPYFSANRTNMTLDDFAAHPAKVNWLFDTLHEGNNSAFPIFDPGASFVDPNAQLLWDDPNEQNIPVDCMTDWWIDRQGHMVNPLDGDRCHVQHGPGLPKKKCHKHTKKYATDQQQPSPPVPVRERFARSLVLDALAASGDRTKALCEDPRSAGPSYANRLERLFCRMTDKTLWPFCEPNEDGGRRFNCFDEEAEVLVEEYAPLARRDAQWDLIEDWHHTGKTKRAPLDGEFIPLD